MKIFVFGFPSRLNAENLTVEHLCHAMTMVTIVFHFFECSFNTYVKRVEVEVCGNECGMGDVAMEMLLGSQDIIVT